MEGWKEKKIGEIAHFLKGKLTEQFEGPYPSWLPLINAEAINSESQFYANPNGAVVCDENDILMLWDGERSGLVATGKSGVVGSTFSKITLNSEIDSLYCFYFLQNQFDWIQNRRTGTGVPHVSKDLAKTLSISFPSSLSEQRKIATIHSTIDKSIAQTEQLIDKYKNIKQGLIHDLLTFGIDQNGNIRNPKTHAFVEKKEMLVPEEWEVEEIGKATSYVDYRGKTPDKCDDGIFLITAKNIKFGYIDYEISKEYIRVEDFDYVMSRGKAQIGDVLITTEAPLGNIAQVDRNEIALAQRVIKYCGNDGVVDNNFLAKYLMSYQFQNQLRQQSSGSTVTGIKGSRLHKLLIAFPKSYIEQQNIAKVLNKQDSLIESEQTNLSKLQNLKQGLMQDLLTGKVRVNL